MFRFLRREFGLTSREIGELTPVIVRHQYLTPDKDEEAVEAKTLVGRDEYVEHFMARGYTRGQAVKKAAELRLNSPPPKKKSSRDVGSRGIPRPKDRPKKRVRH